MYLKCVYLILKGVYKRFFIKLNWINIRDILRLLKIVIIYYGILIFFYCIVVYWFWFEEIGKKVILGSVKRFKKINKVDI